jgi:type VI secretion system Hcp family effector
LGAVFVILPYLNNIPMNTKSLIAGFALLAAYPLTAQNMYIAPVNAGTTTVPATANFGGESKEIAHVGWTELTSTSFSIENATTARSGGGGAGAGRVSAGNFVMTKPLDGSSQYFLGNSFTAKNIPLLTIEYAKGGSDRANVVYQVIVLKDVRVASYKQNCGENGTPVEEIALNYGTIEVTYNRLDNTGKPVKGKTNVWNFVTNTGSGN